MGTGNSILKNNHLQPKILQTEHNDGYGINSKIIINGNI